MLQSDIQWNFGNWFLRNIAEAKVQSTLAYRNKLTVKCVSKYEYVNESVRARVCGPFAVATLTVA